MQIIISNDAKSAITDIYDYSYNISSNYASRIINQIYDAIYNLQNSPYIGRYVPEFSDKHFENLSVKNIELFIIFLKKIKQFLYVTYFAEGKILIYFLKFMKKNYLIFLINYLFKFLFGYIPNPLHGLYNMHLNLLLQFLLLRHFLLIDKQLSQPFLSELVLLYQYHLK